MARRPNEPRSGGLVSVFDQDEQTDKNAYFGVDLTEAECTAGHEAWVLGHTGSKTRTAWLMYLDECYEDAAQRIAQAVRCPLTRPSSIFGSCRVARVKEADQGEGQGPLVCHDHCNFSCAYVGCLGNVRCCFQEAKAKFMDRQAE